MKNRGLCFALAFMLMLFGTSCSSSSAKAQAKGAAEAGATKEIPAAEKSFETTDQLLHITADEDWEDAENLLNIEDASLAVSRNGAAYIAIISEYRWNFPIGLEDYNDMVMKQIKDHVDNDKAGESERISIGDYDAFCTRITGLVGKENQAYRIYCVQAGDYYIQMICWCPIEREKAFGVEFDRIAHTLQLAENAGEKPE